MIILCQAGKITPYQIAPYQIARSKMFQYYSVYPSLIPRFHIFKRQKNVLLFVIVDNIIMALIGLQTEAMGCCQVNVMTHN
mmetsp:Transcript_2279/g.5406  ORF Transcript_2279/g.5406 Transcript_2279/m.5406 type:complete len:81 (+) Transcript_2279:106-348(+)